jgi:hypothetical protein
VLMSKYVPKQNGIKQKIKMKTNTTILNLSTVTKAVSHLGFAAMLVATVVGMADLAEREGQKAMAVLQNQPAYAYAADTSSASHGAQTQSGQQEEPMLRRAGKEEIHHASATYGSARRSPSVTGSL